MSVTLVDTEGASDSVLLTPVVKETFTAPASSLLLCSFTEPPLKVARASGSYVYLEDGRPILDACGGAAAAIIGHGNDEVTQATVAQMKEVSYVHTMAYTTDSAVELARSVLTPYGSGGFDHGLVKAFFVGSGSEANDTAMKCARQYWFEKGQPQRKFYVSREQSYHGNTIGALSVSSAASRKTPYHDILLPNVSYVSAADSYHGSLEGETDEQMSERLVKELESEFLRLGPENVVSFIAEPVVGASLAAMPAPKGYWPGVRALCDKYDILLHLDEVMCGVGRCGTYFSFEHEGIKPDIVTIAKGLGGGYAPIGAMLMNNKIVEALRAGTSMFNNAHTYQAHPVSCATALAVQKIIRRERLVERVAVLGELFGKQLQSTFDGCDYVGNIRGRGLFWSIEFMQNKASKTPFPRDVYFGMRVQRRAFELGVAIYPGFGTIDGVMGDHVLFAPPYTITKDELLATVSTVKKAYDEVAASCTWKQEE